METGVKIFNLAAKLDSPSLKARVDKTDIKNLKTAVADINKLRNLVDYDYVKKPAYYI